MNILEAISDATFTISVSSSFSMHTTAFWRSVAQTPHARNAAIVDIAVSFIACARVEEKACIGLGRFSFCLLAGIIG